MTDIDGLTLAARYAFMPNYLHYCGPPNAHRIIFRYCTGIEKVGEVRRILREFEGLYPYQRIIARCNDIDSVFDYGVSEAYWIGNELLENVETKNLRDMMIKDFSAYLPGRVITYLAETTPEGSKAHHSFHALHIQTITGRIKKTIENQDRCRISWGVVEEIQNPDAIVRYRPLLMEKGRFVLGNPVKKKIKIFLEGKSFIPDVEIDDTISFHWDFGVQILNKNEIKNLEKYTKHHIGLIKPID